MMVELASRSWGWAPRVVGWWLALGLQIACASDLQERVCPFPAGSAKFWLFGELHGSVEAPAHFLSMVKAAVLCRERILVVYEAEQALFDAVASLEASDLALAASQGWLPSAALRNPLLRLSDDGRSSRAMVQMLAGLRLLQLQGWAVQVRGLIVGSRGSVERLMQWVESELPAKVLALMGNFHSQLHNDARQYPSFAQRLAQVVGPAALESIVYLFPPGAVLTCPVATVPCTPTPMGTPVAVQFADLQGHVVRQASHHPRYTALQAAFPAIHIYSGVVVLGGATPSEVTSTTPQPKENP